MSDALQLKVRLVIRQNADTTYRQDVDLRDLSSGALRLLARIEPRIQDRDFYDLPMMRRTINVQARTMLDASSNPDRPAIPHPDHVLLPEISSRDPRFEVGAYGHPRYTETYVKWLDGCANLIVSALEARRQKLAAVHRLLDRRLDDWLSDLATHDDPAKLVVSSDDAVWRLNWNRIRLTRSTAEDEALKLRLRDRVQEAGCRSFREYLLQVPGCERFVAAADDSVRAPEAVPAY